MTENKATEKAELYTRYPLKSVVNYNGTTLLHYLLGCTGIIYGYQSSAPAYLFGLLYLGFAIVQMYLLMPLMVCPNCPYYRMENARCISAQNIVSKRIAKPGDPKNFSKRGEGLLCHNNLYMAALFIPILGMIPALIVNFSVLLLAIFLGVVVLLVYRIFYLFQKVACVQCYAKNVCPNAIAMGLSEKK